MGSTARMIKSKPNVIMPQPAHQPTVQYMQIRLFLISPHPHLQVLYFFFYSLFVMGGMGLIFSQRYRFILRGFFLCDTFPFAISFLAIVFRYDLSTIPPSLLVSFLHDHWSITFIYSRSLCVNVASVC
jgi:hypothetical protein